MSQYMPNAFINGCLFLHNLKSNFFLLKTNLLIFILKNMLIEKIVIKKEKAISTISVYIKTPYDNQCVWNLTRDISQVFLVLFSIIELLFYSTIIIHWILHPGIYQNDNYYLMRLTVLLFK